MGSAREHSNLKNTIRLELGKRNDCVLFNNESGVARYPSGHTVRYGVGAGGSDLIGLTDEGRFLALEVKTGAARCTKKQRHFLALIENNGGFSAIVRTVEEAHAAVTAARRRIQNSTPPT